MLKSLLNEIDTAPNRVKQFAWLFAVIGLVIIPGFIYFKHSGLTNISMYSIGFGSLFLLLGLIRYQILIPIYKIWMLLALVLGLIMTKVIITIVYYAVMTPIGLFKRGHFNKTMHLKFSRDSKTYWVKKEWNSNPKRLEKLF
jgi:hypothetical protein